VSDLPVFGNWHVLADNASPGYTAGISWQITPRVLTDALAAGDAEAKRALAAMMGMGG